MGLVLWIDENKFATGLIEKAFKAAQKSFYHIDSTKDFAYLVEDLKPEIIYLDTATFLKGAQEFKAQYDQSLEMQKMAFIFDQLIPELEFIHKKMGTIPKPINPFELPEKIQKFIELI